MSTVLMHALQDPRLYAHDVRGFRVLETHISWVLLTGQYAYKIKKPVNLGFLNFSTLEQRRHFCDEELRLNRRFAPQLYLEVVAIRGTAQQPHFDGAGPVLDYAVKMLEFEQDQRVDVLLASDKLDLDSIGQFATDLAVLHTHAAGSHPTDVFGSPAAVWAPIAENFAQIRATAPSLDVMAALATLEQWSRREFTRLQATVLERKQAGKVRECHGDLHTSNLVRIDGRIHAFDCIEFNANLRWIDMISEVAFLVMDLQACGRSRFAARFLNRYLEHSGDYLAVRLLNLYLSYRALVRAKVAGLQTAPEARADFQKYLSLAQRYTCLSQPALIIMHGVSGSGKSTVSQALADRLNLIRVRSDVERKRMFASTPARAPLHDNNLYSTTATAAVYQQLATLAESILTAGYGTVLDATFLQSAQRTLLRELAQRLHVPFVIIYCHAPQHFLEHAITQRVRAGNDPSDADVQVLQHQIANKQPLDGTEIALTIEADTSVNFDADALERQLRQQIEAANSRVYQ